MNAENAEMFLVSVLVRSRPRPISNYRAASDLQKVF